jgi:hypothetical protein
MEIGDFALAELVNNFLNDFEFLSKGLLLEGTSS